MCTFVQLHVRIFVFNHIQWNNETWTASRRNKTNAGVINWIHVSKVLVFVTGFNKHELLAIVTRAFQKW